MYSDRSVVHVRFTQHEMLPRVGEVREARGLARWRYRVLEILESQEMKQGNIMVTMHVERWIIEEQTNEEIRSEMTDASDLEVFLAIVLWYLSNEISIAMQECRYREYDDLVQVQMWLKWQLVPGWKIP